MLTQGNQGSAPRNVCCPAQALHLLCVFRDRAVQRKITELCRIDDGTAPVVCFVASAHASAKVHMQGDGALTSLWTCGKTCFEPTANILGVRKSAER